MSCNVFFFLKINDKFVRLADMDEVLCQSLGLTVSSNEYLIPEGNTVNWVDMLASVILDLPSSVYKNEMIDMDDVIEAVCHYNTELLIHKVDSFLRCFNLLKAIGVKCIAHFANLSMFNDKERNYYHHIHDNDIWMSRQELQEYMKEVDISDDVKMSHKTILQRLFNQKFVNGGGNPNEFLCSYNDHKIYKNESGLFECSDCGKLLNYFPDRKNLFKTNVRDVYGNDLYYPCVQSLNIPEGVTSFENEFFRGGVVNKILCFPSTIEKIGDYSEASGVFADSILPEVIIPRTVKIIGRLAFGHSQIKRLVFEDSIQCLYARQFKDSTIDELVISRAIWESDGFASTLMGSARIQNLILI